MALYLRRTRTPPAPGVLEDTRRKISVQLRDKSLPVVNVRLRSSHCYRLVEKYGQEMKYSLFFISGITRSLFFFLCLHASPRY